VKRLSIGLPIASAEQVKAAFDRAEEFLRASNFYSSVRGTAKCAIAEYILYTIGCQMESE
jgi:hypothetical protein